MAKKTLTQSQPKVYDSGYKKLFSNRTIFRQLIESFIHELWVKELDFSTCETLDKSFITDHYKETESDLIYKLQLRGKSVFIYVLLEFQSKVDRFMVIPVLFYILSFYMDYRANHPNVQKLPAVFPIVLYNGKNKWSAATNIQDLIESEPSLGDYAIRFNYLLLNERKYSKKSLLAIRNIVSTLFLAEGHYDITLLETEFEKLYDNEADKQAFSLFLNWFHQLAVYGKITPEDYEKLDRVYKDKEEVKTMLVQTFEKERKKIYEEAKSELRQTFEQERKKIHEEAQNILEQERKQVAEGIEAQRQTLLRFVHWRFATSEAEQSELAQQLAQIDNLQHLTTLSELFLKVDSFADFCKWVTTYLPVPASQDKI